MPTDSAKRIHAGKVDNTLDAFLKSGKQDIPSSLRITGENRFFMAFSVRGNRSGVYNRIDSAYRVAHLREIAQIKTIDRVESSRFMPMRMQKGDDALTNASGIAGNQNRHISSNFESGAFPDVSIIISYPTGNSFIIPLESLFLSTAGNRYKKTQSAYREKIQRRG
jgi:hypothetical protein